MVNCKMKARFHFGCPKRVANEWVDFEDDMTKPRNRIADRDVGVSTDGVSLHKLTR